MQIDANIRIDHIRKIVSQALDEDIGDGDVTTNSIVPGELMLEGKFKAKQAGIVAGLEVARIAFEVIDEQVQFVPHITDGGPVTAGQVFASVSGLGRALLTAERVALNFLQRMSGIATITQRFVEAVVGTQTVILDTRKTAPGLRVLDKWAVHLGGGQNHRFGLYDMALIKENHVAAAGGISEAVARIRAQDDRRLVEVEVRNLDELQEALGLDVDRVLLDNMSLTEMREAVRLTSGRVPLEASGNITLENVGAVAGTGVNYISVGALTHSVQALDISLLLDVPRG